MTDELGVLRLGWYVDSLTTFESGGRNITRPALSALVFTLSDCKTNWNPTSSRSPRCSVVCVGWLPLTTWTLRLPVQTCVFATGDDQVLKMRNYGRGPTPVVAVRQQADHPWTRRISEYPPYRPPHLPLAILYLIFNFCSVSDLLACRLVCPQPRRHNILHGLTMMDNRCAGPLTTSSPTAISWCTKPLSSTNTGSTSVLPPGPQQALPSPSGSVARRSEAPSGLKTVIAVTRSESIYELNYVDAN